MQLTSTKRFTGFCRRWQCATLFAMSYSRRTEPLHHSATLFIVVGVVVGIFLTAL